MIQQIVKVPSRKHPAKVLLWHQHYMVAHNCKNIEKHWTLIANFTFLFFNETQILVGLIGFTLIQLPAFRNLGHMFHLSSCDFNKFLLLERTIIKNTLFFHIQTLNWLWFDHIEYRIAMQAH